MRFLLIEDNADLARSVRERLEMDGHAVDHAASLADADDHLAVAGYDLILLDITLPDGDGRGFLQRHRAARADTPVIVLTARSAVSDRVDTLDLGADDYLTKPFEFEELLARMRALLRRGEASEGRTLRCDNLELDLYTRYAKRGEEEIELSNKEFALLEYLMRNPNRVLSRTQIAEKVWDMNYEPGSNVIDVYISALRKKLDRGHDHELFHTIKGAGYRFGIMD